MSGIDEGQPWQDKIATKLRGDFIMRSRMTGTLLMTLLLSSISAIAETIYENGPQNIHENLGAFTFTGTRFTVSDTFTVSGGNSSITGLEIWAWGWPYDHQLTAEVTITSQPNGGTVYFDQTVQFSESGCYADGFGFSHCQKAARFNAGPTLPNGIYWVNLKNGNTPSGSQAFWDSNAGAGCQSQGCPSQAQQTGNGTVPSEAFTLLGTTGGSNTNDVPKTSGLLLFGSGFVGLIGLVRRKMV
jgi:hypothetical protein